MAKRCRRCNKDKQDRDFPIGRTHDGREHICRECSNKRLRDRVAANKVTIAKDRIYEELMRIV